MNKTIVIVGGVIVVVAIIVGGIVYAQKNNVILPPAEDTTTVPVVKKTDPNPVVLKPGMPVVITNTSVSPTDTTAIVKGSINPKGAFASYWYEYGLSSNLGNKTANQTVGSGFTTISAPGYITGLIKDTSYFFRLVAENQYGRIMGTVYSFKTTLGNPIPVGNVPVVKTVVASNVSRTGAVLNGEVTPNKVKTEYWFEYGKTTELGNTSAFSSMDESSVKLPVSISLSDLIPETTYYFRLNAQNQFGTANGSILNFKTPGPTSAKAPSVTTGNVTAITSSSATLHGTVNPNLAETKYWFEYSINSALNLVPLNSTDQKSAGAGSSTVSVETNISSLSSKVTYYFRLVAQNNLGIIRGEIRTFRTK